ncbi:DNA helicase II [Gynuella sp.]|uniref:DNA helicase II n=1 Tax=Gynuella sp. TaxID=2969146 RepID=UPI003D0C16C9
MQILEQLVQLNSPQQQAVKSDRQHLLVLAGAGSGKTRVLTHRIAWLVETGLASPNGILAVTFTNKAAREMRQRVEELLPFNPRGMWIGTFHGLAHRLLKAHWKALKLPESFQVLDSDDQLRLVKRVMADIGINDETLQPKTAQWYINEQKDEGRRAAHVMESNDPFDTTLRKIYLAYEQACERSGVVDFGELLLRAHELWLNHPPILEHYQQRFRYVLVDEFQDINTIQYAWLRVLCGQQSHLTVVGDDDQSIYGWRGAKVENIQQFSKDYPDTEIIRLEQNYRSTATILKAANAVIDNNSGRLGKELWTTGEEGDPIDVYAAFNEIDEARYLAEQIEQLLEQGENALDVAILYRSNAQSRVLEEALIQARIPYRIYGGLRFYERQEVKNVLAYMRLIANRFDDAAMERIINVPTRAIGGKTVETLRAIAREQGCALWQAASLAVHNKLLPSRASNAVHTFIELIDELEQGTAEMELHELTQYVIDASGLKEHHQKEKGEKARARLENMQELVSATRNFNVEQEDVISPLDAFLSEVSLDAGERQADDSKDSVSLMTLHSAKGLEFPYVFIVGMEESLFPHKMSMDELTGLEEERRLCYVGITRAMRKLTVCYAESRRMFGNETFNRPSRFISEIPAQLLNEIRLKSTLGSGFSAAGSGFKEEVASGYGIQLGQRVMHPFFGEGVVMAASGNGANASVTVEFESEGTKELMLQYAKLSALES